MKFLDIMAKLSGVWIVIWIAIHYYALHESSELAMCLGVFLVFAGFSIYCFRLLDHRNRWGRRFRRAIGTLLWLCVFLPPFSNCLLRLVFATVGIDSSTDPNENISDLANASVVSIFFLLLINWQMFFARPFWRSGVAVGLLMFCIGFLGEYHKSTEGIMIRLTQNIGKTSAEIKKLVGNPQAIEGSLRLKGLPTEAATCDENWLYEFNYKYVLVSFRNGKCVSAKECDPTSYFECQNKNLNRAITVAKGKTREAIIKLLGMPTRMESSKTPGFEVETWAYYGTEFGTGFNLNFQNGVCTEAERYQIYQ